MSKIYGIYDMKNKEQCVCVGTISELNRCINISAREMGSAIKKNNLIRETYELHYLFNEKGV